MLLALDFDVKWLTGSSPSKRLFITKKRSSHGVIIILEAVDVTLTTKSHVSFQVSGSLILCCHGHVFSIFILFDTSNLIADAFVF